MKIGTTMPRAASALCVCLAVAAACSGSAPPSSPAASPSSPPDFGLEVTPASFVGRAIGGQRVVFLVTASGSPTDGPVRLAATAGASTVAIEPEPLEPGVVGEVTIVPQAPADSQEPVDIGVAITGTRDRLSRTVERTFQVAPGTDGLGAEAADHLAPFAAWLAANRPQLGIAPQTSWRPTPGTWVLVVNHYAFFSDDWELELAWHVMIPPDDWARIALRRRWTEAKPSLAFEIASFSQGTQPREIEPPADVWR